METIIEVKGLRKVYTTYQRGRGTWNALKSIFRRKYIQKEALKEVSFSIKKGEIVGLIGPNGAGKSTIIKTLSGVLYPTSGSVKVLGYTPWKDRESYVQNIGVVFGQKEDLYWDLPPLDSFALNKELYSISDKDFEKRIAHMVKILNIGHIIETPVRDLSLGERMKCKALLAMLHNPKIVFLDEPSIGLDVIAKGNLRDFILDINKKQVTTFIITTHDMQDIERLCKRVIIINSGEIIYDGLLSTIKKRIMDNKLLDIKFAQKPKKFKLKGCKVIEATNYSIKVDVNTKKQDLKKVINYLMENFEFADLVISDPPIEEIIKKVYERKQP